MTSSKLISITAVVAVVLMTMSMSPAVNAQGNLASLINALTPGSTTDQTKLLYDFMPQMLKNKMNPQVAAILQRIPITQLKQDAKGYKDALLSCIKMTSMKQCIDALKKVDPEINNLLTALKNIILKQKSKVNNFLENLKNSVNSQILKNIISTMQNILQMAPPPSGIGSRRRRRKRSVTIIDVQGQITIIKSGPMTFQQVKDLIKSAIKNIMAILKSPPPPNPPSLLQQIINMLSSMSSTLKTLFSNPKIMSLLGTSAPPS